VRYAREHIHAATTVTLSHPIKHSMNLNIFQPNLLSTSIATQPSRMYNSIPAFTQVLEPTGKKTPSITRRCPQHVRSTTSNQTALTEPLVSLDSSNVSYPDLSKALEEIENTPRPPIRVVCAVCGDECPIETLPSLAACTYPLQTCGTCYAGWVTYLARTALGEDRKFVVNVFEEHMTSKYPAIYLSMTSDTDVCVGSSCPLVIWPSCLEYIYSDHIGNIVQHLDERTHS
jgi:hypothetical protein